MLEFFPEAGNLFHPFEAKVPFLYPLKTSENQRFSDIFMG